MREIKFRMYSPMSKKMYYFENNWNDQKPRFQPEYCNMTLSLKSEMDDDDRWSMDDDDLEWMQFTGHHDRDGKEVYEGDLLRHDWTLDGEERHALSEVFWDAGMLAFRLITRSAYGSKKELRVHFTPPELSPIDHYVVGNIYENPELLTKN